MFAVPCKLQKVNTAAKKTGRRFLSRNLSYNVNIGQSIKLLINRDMVKYLSTYYIENQIFMSKFNEPLH